MGDVLGPHLLPTRQACAGVSYETEFVHLPDAVEKILRGDGRWRTAVQQAFRVEL